MVPVAVITGRSRKVALDQETLGMPALQEIFILVGRDFVIFHILFIRMTLGAGLGDIDWIYGRIRNCSGKNSVGAVAASACRRFRIASRQLLAVYAGPVGGELVHRHRGVEFSHVLQIAVAFSTQAGNVGGLGASDESLFFRFDHSEVR